MGSCSRPSSFSSERSAFCFSNRRNRTGPVPSPIARAGTRPYDGRQRGKEPSGHGIFRRQGLAPGGARARCANDARAANLANPACLKRASTSGRFPIPQHERTRRGAASEQESRRSSNIAEHRHFGIGLIAAIVTLSALMSMSVGLVGLIRLALAVYLLPTIIAFKVEASTTPGRLRPSTSSSASPWLAPASSSGP